MRGAGAVNLAHYLGLLQRAEANLATALREVAAAHPGDADIPPTCTKLAADCDEHVSKLSAFVSTYGADTPDQPDRLHATLFQGPRSGGLALLRDLHDLSLMTCECDLAWTVISQAAEALRDGDLLAVVRDCHPQTGTTAAWLQTRIRQAAPQALVVAR
jgi:hypothetical protein